MTGKQSFELAVRYLWDRAHTGYPPPRTGLPPGYSIDVALAAEDVDADIPEELSVLLMKLASDYDIECPRSQRYRASGLVMLEIYGRM